MVTLVWFKLHKISILVRTLTLLIDVLYLFDSLLQYGTLVLLDR